MHHRILLSLVTRLNVIEDCFISKHVIFGVWKSVQLSIQDYLMRFLR
jgi:hypothetical protein